MILQSFRTHHLSIPLEREMLNGSFGFRAIEHILLELRAGDAVGIGHAFAFEPYQAQSIRAMVIDLAQSLVGEPIDDAVAVWKSLWRRMVYIGHAGPPVMALSTVDTAVWDLLAQDAGVPLHRLLGADDTPLPVYATGGWMSATTDELVAEARTFADRGFAGYKMKVGHADWRTDVERVGAVADAVGDELVLMVDANQGWSVDQAIAAGAALAQLGVRWLEEPVVCEDVEGSARVAAALDLPVVSGESIFTSHGFRPLLERRAADVLMPDVMRCGGPTEFLRVAALSDAYGVPVSSHAFTEVSAPLMAACSRAAMVEYVPGWTERLFEDGLVIEDGLVHLSQRPGLGVRFDSVVIEAYSVQAEGVAEWVGQMGPDQKRFGGF